ncbi:beta-1,3-galactosyltransferase 1-like [Contarinia nasturtii]|uniref:beta-1,3-galactosyltransferase 1-like n=1 Tax=Contarinia nasturtii TaxID=265458 RepID=UPI0012D3B97D|nr:beta-1,3-galactosyltransferase 1-like [Contarinia nasturtii]
MKADVISKPVSHSTAGKSFNFKQFNRSPIGIFKNAQNPAKQPVWEIHHNRSIPHYISPSEYTAIIDPQNLFKENEQVLLLFVIFSNPNHFTAREILRQTWANTSEFNYSQFSKMHGHLKEQYLPFNHPEWKRYAHEYDTNEIIDGSDFDAANFRIRRVFLIGQTETEEMQNQVLAESQKYNDIIQEDFVDTYKNLTLKTAMMMKWVNNNCAEKVKFIMKADEDTFVNVPNLIHFLLGGTIPVYNATLNRYVEQYKENIMDVLHSNSRLSYEEDLLIGCRLCSIMPCSVPEDKWFSPPFMYDREIFPIFLAGGSGYVFTMSTAAKLYKASMEVPLVLAEDAYFTGICAEKAKIQPKNFHLFNNGYYSDMCDFLGGITQHQTELNVLKFVYDIIMNSDYRCATPPNQIETDIKDSTESCSDKFAFRHPNGNCAGTFYNLPTKNIDLIRSIGSAF